MKKLSFFLMAMLFSVMSFAQDAAYKTALFGASYNSKKISSYTATWTATNDGFTVTIANANNNNNDWNYIKMGRKNNASVGSITTSVAIDKPIASVTLTIDAITASKINSIVLKTSTDGNTYTQVGTFNKATGNQTVELNAPAANLYYQIVADCASGTSNGLVTISKVQYFAAEGGEQGPKVAAPVFNVTETAFTEAFTLTITSEEGTTLKYTTDDTDPITSGTAVVVNSNTATIDIPAVSTVVKAVAVKDELVSSVKSVTYCYVNSAETAYTVAEAIAIIDAGLGLDNELYAKGEICQVDSYNATYKSITYWIQDEQGNKLQVYSGKGLNNADFSSKEELVLGARVVICGILKKYNTTYEFDKNNYIVSIEYDEPVIFADDFHFDAIAFGAEVEAQTLTVTAENLTADITATLDNEDFTVTPATLPAAGGDLTIAPAADLTVGEHTATLTLTSGETTKEVTLSVLVKDVYAIEWYVNGEIYDETTVVEGDKLVLPAAPEAPDACSEKVFVGWTAAETVNADDSEIEWITATTVPTAAATYYAVFALQEGEGGASEVVDVLDRALTGVEGTNYASWADVSATSDAVYAGQSAGGNEAIQLRSTNSNSGVISTTSGGKLAKITVTWNSNTAEGRTLNVYGRNTAYTAPTELYGDASGDKLGTIVCGTSTELVIDGDYAYVGLRSNSGAMYLDEIQITWIAGAAATYTDYSTTCEPEIPTYTVTVSDNTGGVEPLTTGGGEYTKGENATVTASEDVEGWVFVGWMANEEFVANDPTYTFAVEGNTELVAVYAGVMEDEITNLVIDTYMMALIGGPSTNYAVEVILGLGEDNGEGGFILSDESYVSIMGDEATWIDGMAFDIDPDANVATAIVVVEFGGTYYAFTLTMSAAPAEPIEVVVENATVTLSKYTVSETESAYELTMVADWTYEKDGLTYEVECLLPTFDPTNESGNYAANFFVRGDGDAFGMVEGANVLVTIENQTLKLTGEISTYNGNVYNVTISGTLPAVPSALDNVTTTVAPVKAIVNGQLVILKDGVQYNAQGAVVK